MIKKDNSVFVQERDLRFEDKEIEFWENWLPKNYAIKISEKTKFSISLINKVKRGWKYNHQIVTVLNDVAEQRKKELFNK